MGKFLKIFILLAFFVFLVAGGLFLLKKKKEELTKLPSPQIPVYTVEGYKVKRGFIKEVWEGIGKIEPGKRIYISTKIPGFIKEIPFREGDTVKRGNTLVLIDDTPVKKEIQNLNLSLSSLKSQLEALKIQKDALFTNLQTKKHIYERDKVLYKKKAIPKEKLEISLTEYKKAFADYSLINSKIKELQVKISQIKNQIDIKKNSLLYLKVKSPVDGVVSKVFLEEGSLAPIGKSILTLQTTKYYKIIFSYPPEIPIKKGTVVYIGRNIKTTVFKIYPASDRNSLNIGEIRTETLPDNLKTGAILNLRFVLKEKYGLKVPDTALLHLTGQTFVLVKDKEGIKKIPVKVLASDGFFSIIEGNIKEGMLVATAPESKLRLLLFSKKALIKAGEE